MSPGIKRLPDWLQRRVPFTLVWRPQPRTAAIKPPEASRSQLFKLKQAVWRLYYYTDELWVRGK